MNYSDNNNQGTIGAMKTAFLAGMVFYVCFTIPILQNSGRAIFEVDNKINPNTASAGELAQLPNIGMAKAQAIVDYRQTERKTFERTADLENVRGIGKKTVDKIEQWIRFNDTE
ncbi:MAG: helix-hairpin-helix domain-containing protein [Phycisphaerae bacterium]|jgi:competence protein ComEA